MLEGFQCKCGFKTIAKTPVCPRCGRTMSPHKFFDEGKVLSFVPLSVPPVAHEKRMNMIMVEIDNGPKLICWTEEKVATDQRVRIFFKDGLPICKSP